MNPASISVMAFTLAIILFISECNILRKELHAATDTSKYTAEVYPTTEPPIKSSKVHTTTDGISEPSSLDFFTSTTSQAWIQQWDKRTMTARDYQTVYCSRFCLGNTLLYFDRTDQCQLFECFRCDCHKPLCELYGTCCPDYETSLPVNISTFTSIDDPIERYNMTCMMDTEPSPVFIYNASNSWDVKFICELVGEKGYLFIRSCPVNYAIDSRERTRCEEDIPAPDQDFETFLPVTDKATGHTYYNRYCAICNNVTNFTVWNITKACYNYIKVYQAKTPEEFLKLGLEPDSDCDVLKTPPSNISPQTCRRSWFASVVSSCNVTGQWDVYDEDVVKACEDISGLANRTRYGPVMYKNIFCALCNIKAFSGTFEYCGGCIPSRGSSEIILPFSFLLNLNSHINLDIEKCPENTIWGGPDKTCLPLQCSSGKALNNGTCSTVNPEIKELMYQLRVLYIPGASVMHHPSHYNTNYSHELFYHFLKLIRNIIFSFTPLFEVQLSMLYSNSTSNITTDPYDPSSCLLESPSPCDVLLPWISLKAEFWGSSYLSRDDFEILFLSALFANSTTLTTDNNFLTLKPILKPERLSSQFDCTNFHDEAFSCLSETLLESYNSFLDYNKNEFLVVEPQLNCPFITLNSSDYSYKNDSLDNSSITLYLSNEPITISELDDLNLMSISGDGTLKICQELWEKNIKSYLSSSDIENSLLVLFEYILTWVCLLSSIICLVLTVMTYLLFPVLRSVAGKNNVFLSLSLLLAQSFLLAASHVKQTGYLCTFLAISTHFLWLSMFCWCFTTCFHMFRIFTAQTRSIHATATSERLHLVKRVVGCIVIPALIIVTVVVTSYFTNSGRFIGYGHDKCFLDSTPLVVITLATPLSFILLCNIFFFSVTIIKIHNVRKLQTYDFKQDDRANLYIYIKLSSMTGMFWILNIIAEATDNDPLRFIAIFLNGLQGVFIFLSYICNRRVLKLYARALRLEILLPTTSTSDRSTMAKVLSEKTK